ncbi:MAG: hypothetical protein JO316_01530 [Abitibacteriaceae bacterium]|nr:hypothetical protein [Abditibacteriaceae bacterium]MBV9864011.1 hypothetical protein [Abditibacteriaceae bacterium]
MRQRLATVVSTGLMTLSVMMASSGVARADGVPEAAQLNSSHPPMTLAQAPAPGAANPQPAVPVSGQGKFRFKVFLTSERLPEEAKKVLRSAHGGSAVDHRPGKGETYFFLRGAGILRVSADMQSVQLVPTAPAMKNVNMHNTTIWYGPDGAPYLVFPANETGQIFTTNLEGKLLNTLGIPTAGQELGNTTCNEYFAHNGKFAPTGVEYLDGLYYVSTGYCDLDYVLTAQVSFNPISATWNDLSFGGRGTGEGKFGTGHSITVPPGLKRIDVADRPNARIERFSRYGRYLSTLTLPAGTLACDIDYWGNYAVVPALDGPDRTKGAPIYFLENDQVVSTILPKEELGLKNFQHIHNAVLREVGGKLYIITQAWNPGDFAILEQVTE